MCRPTSFHAFFSCNGNGDALLSSSSFSWQLYIIWTSLFLHIAKGFKKSWSFMSNCIIITPSEGAHTFYYILTLNNLNWKGFYKVSKRWIFCYAPSKNKNCMTLPKWAINSLSARKQTLYYLCMVLHVRHVTLIKLIGKMNRPYLFKYKYKHHSLYSL